MKTLVLMQNVQMIKAIQSSLIFLAFATTTNSWAQLEPVEKSPLQWQLSAGMNQYTEPSLMQLVGPEIGLHVHSFDPNQLEGLQLEGDFLLGLQKYTSRGTGSLDNVTNIETRWRALAPIYVGDSAASSLSVGVGIHTLWNDLRGTTTTNHGGYRRMATQLWLPIRWNADETWQFDAGLLLYGVHTSVLSDVSADYGDVTNTQHRGTYLQMSMNLSSERGTEFTPFLRYTHLSDSDIVVNREREDLVRRYEPASQRWQIGATWRFN
jgi:hypothetical protein